MREANCISILTDSEGIIQEVIRDDLEILAEDCVGMALHQIFPEHNRASIQRILQVVRINQACFEAKLLLDSVDGSKLQLNLSAGKSGEQILFVGAFSEPDVSLEFYRELMRINNDQINQLRNLMKEKYSQNPEQGETAVYFQMSQLNNQLIDLQRSMAKKNFELERQNREIGLLNEMNNTLNSCETLSEAYKVIVQYTIHLMPHSSGLLLTYDPSNKKINATDHWGDPMPAAIEKIFVEMQPLFNKPVPFSEISSVQEQLLSFSLLKQCTLYPLLGQQGLVGLIQICSQQPESNTESFQEQFFQTFLKQIGLALANLQLRERLRQESTLDFLTGLYNRRFLERQMEREISRAMRRGTALCVVLFDLDRFKSYNDQFGHDVGDQILIQISAALSKNFRKEDCACRYGGDEFAILIPDISMREIFPILNRTREQIRAIEIPHSVQKISGITISAGVACFPQNGTTPTELLKAADKALYEVKRSGRDGVKQAST